ncbi:MAG: NapC/NirT family cytochrome c [candidate division WOR-3 bacterium]
MKKSDYLVYGALGSFMGAILVFSMVSYLPSYLSDSAEMCSSCHTMQSEYESWEHGAHRNIKCTQCHLPHDNPLKYLAYKARDGFWDAYVYYTRQEPPVIRIKARSKPTLEANCERCHEKTISYIEAMGSDRWCGTCHRETIHPGPSGTGSVIAIKGEKHERK